MTPTLKEAAAQAVEALKLGRESVSWAINGSKDDEKRWEQYTLERIDSTISALESAIAGAGWMPMESAPKDGTVIWAFNDEQARMRWVEGEGYALWIWDDETLNDIDPNVAQPTHWMPLPAPPVSPINTSPERVDSGGWEWTGGFVR